MTDHNKPKQHHEEQFQHKGVRETASGLVNGDGSHIDNASPDKVNPASQRDRLQTGENFPPGADPERHEQHRLRDRHTKKF